MLSPEDNTRLHNLIPIIETCLREMRNIQAGAGRSETGGRHLSIAITEMESSQARLFAAIKNNMIGLWPAVTPGVTEPQTPPQSSAAAVTPGVTE